MCISRKIKPWLGGRQIWKKDVWTVQAMYSPSYTGPPKWGTSQWNLSAGLLLSGVADEMAPCCLIGTGGAHTDSWGRSRPLPPAARHPFNELFEPPANQYGNFPELQVEYILLAVSKLVLSFHSDPGTLKMHMIYLKLVTCSLPGPYTCSTLSSGTLNLSLVLI